MTAVTCPTMRYHPAVVAQCAATSGSPDQQSLHAGPWAPASGSMNMSSAAAGLAEPSAAPAFLRRHRHHSGLAQGHHSQTYRGKHLHPDHAWLFGPARAQSRWWRVAAGGIEAAPASPAVASTRFHRDGSCSDLWSRPIWRAGGSGPRYAGGCDVLRRSGSGMPRNRSPLFPAGHSPAGR